MTTTVTYYLKYNNFNVKVEHESRNIEMYLYWWDLNTENEDKAGFEQQMDVACSICRSYEDIIRHMRINGYDVEDVTDDVIC